MVRTRSILQGLVAGAALLLVSTGVSAQSPTIKEYPYIYKSTRAMGMGGAYTSVGGRADAMFYNPAGLINIPQDKGWEVNLLNISGEAGKNSQDFLKDTQDALDTKDTPGDPDNSADDEQLKAVNDVFAKYRGENLHLRVADFSSVAHSYDRWAFGIGGVASGRIDAMSHQGFGSEGILEVNADALYGALGGVSIGVTDNVFIGLSVKQLHRESLIHNFTPRELVEKQDKLGDYIKDELRVSGDAMGFDGGVIWKFSPDSKLKPALGVSVMNIGDLDFGKAGKIPMTVNTGISISPEIAWSRSLIVGIDYIDVLNGYSEDKDMAKRLRYGAELQLFDIWPAELALRLGMYEGSPTMGFDVRLLFVTVSYAQYTEEVGAYAGQDKDKRQLVTAVIGW